MDLGQSRDAHYRAVADPVRRRLLRLLDESPEPRDVEGLACAVDLHPNTVRGHLDLLEAASLVERSTRPRSGPGRPRIVYTRTPEDDTDWSAGYRLLAEMLTSTVLHATEEPSAAAEEAGWEWGHQLCRSGLSADLISLLDGLGFAPRNGPEDDGVVIDLVDCPFRELARSHREVVCALHLGIMRGAAHALGGSVAVSSLEPFVEPSLCRVVIETSGTG